ncbi:V0D/AC39 family V-type ATPase subunit [Ignicoccus hospitalis]|uniref:Uncharacterized protein n=1 Tax=Ignicoccus hospitalis (strain KIN4/I / DSM 18386 / JCM 14125) TaxID=453591 RepID=A8ABT8_IGNH4|nr:V-type ATPase subunit [Ignicoccus hospitalis]ABU82390.1 hypothetical protein Igni_1214 [Ignicoccus hospitalis KIN4/I]HIH90865.1 V-type ATPase subunit [Desulfurococcaceae archaeon]
MPAELISPTALVYMYRGQILDKEKELSLLTASTPEEVQNALRGTWLEGVAVEEASSEELERLACQKYYEILMKLRGYVPSYNLKLMIDNLVDWLRARDVMLIVRAAVSGKDLKEVEGFLLFKDDPVVSTTLLVIKERGLEGLAQALKGFKMASYIEQAVEMYRSYKDLSAFVLAMDVMLLKSMYNVITRIGKSMNVGTSKIEISKLLCPEIDALAVTLVGRAILKGLKLPAEPPACDQDLVRALVQAKPDEVVPLLRRTPYGEGVPEDPYEALAKVRVNAMRVQRKRALAAFSGYPFRVAVLLALLILLRLDARDVATIMTGKKLGLDPSKIAENLSYELF